MGDSLFSLVRLGRFGFISNASWELLDTNIRGTEMESETELLARLLLLPGGSRCSHLKRSPSAGQFSFNVKRRIAQWFAAFLQVLDLRGLMYIGEPPAPEKCSGLSVRNSALD
jgi:hypothetical protein